MSANSSAISSSELILDVATQLFSQHGYRAVGVDWILREANLGKATFYRAYRSKDELVAAYLGQEGDRFVAWLEAEVAGSAASLRDRPLAIFDALGSYFSSDDFRGCPFIGAIYEFADVGHEAHSLTRNHYERLRRYIERLLEAGGYDSSRELADCLLQVVTGAIITAFRGGANAASTGRSIACCVLYAGSDSAQARVHQRRRQGSSP